MRKGRKGRCEGRGVQVSTRVKEEAIGWIAPGGRGGWAKANFSPPLPDCHISLHHIISKMSYHPLFSLLCEYICVLSSSFVRELFPLLLDLATNPAWTSFFGGGRGLRIDRGMMEGVSVYLWLKTRILKPRVRI